MMGERVSWYGPCDRRERHDRHTLFTVIVDDRGDRVMQDCPGQYADCANCDDRKCMACIFREPHSACADDCPECC